MSPHLWERVGGRDLDGFGALESKVWVFGRRGIKK